MEADFIRSCSCAFTYCLALALDALHLCGSGVAHDLVIPSVHVAEVVSELLVTNKGAARDVAWELVIAILGMLSAPVP